MSELYVIGPGQGTGLYAIGLAKDAAERLVELQSGSDVELKLMRSHPLERGWDTLAAQIVNRQLGYRRKAPFERVVPKAKATNGEKAPRPLGAWYETTSADALTAVDKAFRATQPGKRKEMPRHDFSVAMKKLRIEVFGATMEVIASIAGTTPPTVSRWESGELDPGLAEIKRLRDYASRNGLVWKDSAIFN
jgi:DNA-binding transcriptional regulator YiaG